jgi:co-chaperonin GroES (HSP10)
MSEETKKEVKETMEKYQSSIGLMQANARLMMDRAQNEKLNQRMTTVELDSSNEVSFPEFPYKFRALREKILVTIDVFKSGYECKTCLGKKVVEEKQGRESVFTPCEVCKGTGVWLEIPDSAKMLPTTGVIVSMGSIAKEKLTAENVHLGDRILFGAYAGSLIPTKSGVAFKYMDWQLCAVKITGAEDMAQFDFITTPED